MPVIGRICMDMCFVDTNLDIKEGDEVEIFGPNIPISNLAKSMIQLLMKLYRHFLKE